MYSFEIFPQSIREKVLNYMYCWKNNNPSINFCNKKRDQSYDKVKTHSKQFLE